MESCLLSFQEHREPFTTLIHILSGTCDPHSQDFQGSGIEPLAHRLTLQRDI